MRLGILAACIAAGLGLLYLWARPDGSVQDPGPKASLQAKLPKKPIAPTKPPPADPDPDIEEPIAEPQPQPPKPPSTAKLGQPIDFSALDPMGNACKLRDMKGKKAIVVVILSFDCPIALNYFSILAGLHKTYEPKGVSFLGLVPCDEHPDWVIGEAGKFKMPFPVVKDTGGAAALKADVLSEAFVLDDQYVLRYRGRIDDRFQARLKRNREVTSHDLQQALDEILAGKQVSRPVTRAVGCPMPVDVQVKKDGPVTFHRDVLPILQEHCQSCHRPGQIAPFSFTTYHQALRWAADIKDYTASRKMPPWKPVAGLPMQGHRLLPRKDITTLAQWVDGGMPEGDSRQAPKKREWKEGWQLGKPDLVLEVPEDFEIGPSGEPLWRNYVIPSGLEEGKFISAIDILPGNPRVIHHALILVDEKNNARGFLPPGKSSFNAGLPLVLGFFPYAGAFGWTPGQVPRHMPPGTGMWLPGGRDLLVQIGYQRTGLPESDEGKHRTRIGLYFATKVKRHFRGLLLMPKFFEVPANKSNWEVKGTACITADCQLHSILPHMHLLGKDLKVTMTPPGDKPRTLLFIKEWDYSWQETYFLEKPLAIKAGTQFDIIAHYDNSSGNPNNPNRPPRAMKIGWTSTYEMCTAVLGVTAPRDKSPILNILNNN